MANQLEGNNTQQKLIGGAAAAGAQRRRFRRQCRRKTLSLDGARFRNYYRNQPLLQHRADSCYYAGFAALSRRTFFAYVSKQGRAGLQYSAD
jgi:hypothetical protein